MKSRLEDTSSMTRIPSNNDKDDALNVLGPDVWRYILVLLRDYRTSLPTYLRSRNLHSFLLVSRAFYDIAAPLVYQSIVLSGKRGPRVCEELVHALEDVEERRNWVRRLHVEEMTPVLDLHSFEAVESLIPKLGNLEEVRLGEVAIRQS